MSGLTLNCSHAETEPTPKEALFALELVHCGWLVGSLEWGQPDRIMSDPMFADYLRRTGQVPLVQRSRVAFEDDEYSDWYNEGGQ